MPFCTLVVVYSFYPCGVNSASGDFLMRCFVGKTRSTTSKSPHFQDTFLYDPTVSNTPGTPHILKGGWAACIRSPKLTIRTSLIPWTGNQYSPSSATITMTCVIVSPRNIKQFRKLLSGDQNRPLNFVVDRAIYDLEDLQILLERAWLRYHPGKGMMQN